MLHSLLLSVLFRILSVLFRILVKLDLVRFVAEGDALSLHLFGKRWRGSAFQIFTHSLNCCHGTVLGGGDRIFLMLVDLLLEVHLQPLDALLDMVNTVLLLRAPRVTTLISPSHHSLTFFLLFLLLFLLCFVIAER